VNYAAGNELNRRANTTPVISACGRLMLYDVKYAVLGFEPTTYGSESECATHNFTACECPLVYDVNNSRSSDSSPRRVDPRARDISTAPQPHKAEIIYSRTMAHHCQQYNRAASVALDFAAFSIPLMCLLFLSPLLQYNYCNIVTQNFNLESSLSYRKSTSCRFNEFRIAGHC